jgi:gag-polyprotein putative aspartyl protease
MLFKISKMKNIFVLISLLGAFLTNAQVATDSIKKTIEPAKVEQITIAPCDVNRTSMKFEIDTLSMTVRISAIEALALYKSNELKQANLRMPELYNLEEKQITDGMRINLQQIKIGSLLLTNVDALVVKDQATSIILGKNILLKTGKISIVNNNFKFSNVTEPYLPIKIDMTDDEFTSNDRKILVDYANKELRNNLISNLRRYVRTNEKDGQKELRISLTFKIDLYTNNKNDDKYNEDLEINQKTVAGKMMYDTFKLINSSAKTKSILDFYDTTGFYLVFIYTDKTEKVKHTITRENLAKLPIPFTKEQFLEALTVTKKK